MVNSFIKYKTSNRIYVLGSGRSVSDITPKEWKEINKHDSIWLTIILKIKKQICFI